MLIGFSVSAQMQQVSGLVVDGNARLSGAMISNCRTGLITRSNVQGFFIIRARKGDTLITQLLNYRNDTLLITNQENGLIRLKPASHMLKQVSIRDSVKNSEVMYEQNKKEYKDIYRRGDMSHIFGIGPGIGIPMLFFGVNIDKLYNALSKQGHDARRLQLTLTGDYQNSVVNQRFNRLVARLTGYQGERLNDFIMKYRPTYAYVIKASDYDLAQYIKLKLKAEKENQKTD